jgi:hypothetical protein
MKLMAMFLSLMADVMRLLGLRTGFTGTGMSFVTAPVSEMSLPISLMNAFMSPMIGRERPVDAAMSFMAVPANVHATIMKAHDRPHEPRDRVHEPHGAPRG